jgi:hypothetical protein
LLKRVEGRAGEITGPKRLGQRRFVNQLSAGTID